MTTTTNPNRTTSVIGDETRSGVNCTTCGSSYYTCTRRIETGRSACCPTCTDTDTHDVEVVEAPPPPTEATPNPVREVRSSGNRTIHRTTHPTNRRAIALCGENVLRPVREAREWSGSQPTDLIECATCFNQISEEVLPEPEPQTREVRENANPVVHRTATPANGSPVVTTCGRSLPFLVSNPRVWMGNPARAITDCPTCFPPQVAFRPGDLVHVTGQGTPTSPRNPRGWSPQEVYVYVGQRPANGLHSLLVVPDGWNLSTYTAEPLAPIVFTSGLRDMGRLEAWNVLTRLLVPVEDTETALPSITARMGRARTRLIDAAENTPVLHPVRLCDIGRHPQTQHTHTVGESPAWGDPEHQPASVVRLVHPDTGDYVLFAKGEHVTGHPLQVCDRNGHITDVHTHTLGNNPLWGRPGSNRTGADRLLHDDGTEVLFASTAHINAVPNQSGSGQDTERETPAVPESTLPAVGTELHPLQGSMLRSLPPGTVLTIRSRARGEQRGASLHLGCKEFPSAALVRAQATVHYAPNGITAECDVTLTSAMTDSLQLAGQRISLGELSDYAQSVIVKEVGAPPPPANAIVMEHGFYGCAVHPDEVFILGMGNYRPNDAAAPLLGHLRTTAGTSVRTGTVGVRDGLLNPQFSDCTPVFGSTTAYDMHFATERQWSAVPATAEQIARYEAAQTYRDALGKGCTLENPSRIVRCQRDGSPIVVDQPF